MSKTNPLIFVVIMVVLNLQLGLSQNQKHPDHISLKQKGIALLKKASKSSTAEEGVKLLIEAKECFVTIKDTALLINASADLAIIYVYASEYDNFESEIGQIKKLLAQHQVADSIYYGVQKILVWHAEIIEDFETAEELYQELFQYYLGQSDFYHAAWAANNIAYFYERSISDVERGLEYFKKAIQLLDRSKVKDEPLLASFYSNIGVSYKANGQKERAKYYLHKSLKKYKTQEKSELNDMNIWWNKQNLAAIYLEEHAIDSFKYYGQQALHTLDHDNKSYYDDYQTFQIFGDYYSQIGDLSTALKYYKQSLEKAKKQQDVHRPVNAIVFLADALSGQDNHQEALDSIQKGIQLLCPKFKQDDIFLSPSAQTFTHKKSALNLIQKRAAIFHKCFKENRDIKNLEASLNNYILADELIRLVRQDYSGKSSKYILAENTLIIFESGIEVAYQLYEMTNDFNYLETAFYFAEQNKSTLLLESIKENTAKNFGGLPDSLLQKEKTLKLSIIQLEKKIYTENKLSVLNESLIQSYKQKLFNQREQHQILIDHIEKKYPKYFQFKYRPALASIQEVQKKLLDKNTALLEFFVGEKNIFLFCIKKSTTRLLKIEKPKDLALSFENFKRIFSETPNTNRIHEDIKDFNLHAYRFYQLLLDEALINLSANHLIIVPDDFLIYLPFEILTRQQQQTTGFSLTEQSYLLEDYTISYSFSSSLLLHTKDISYSKQKSFIGFAPDFKDAAEEYSSRSCNENDLYSLQCSKNEVISISNIFKGKDLLQHKARKDSFESIVKDYSIIHLSTHACIDEENPNFSRIYFADDYLSNHDLSNMRIQANLAVLSACNTNVGPLMKGDGVSSISKGFILAGCPSILTSLWAVDDCSTSELMIKFYKNLKSGVSKSSALRQAKLDYLTAAEPAHAHPYYWAPFLLSGQDMAVVESGIGFKFWVLGALVIILIGFLFLLRKAI